MSKNYTNIPIGWGLRILFPDLRFFYKDTLLSGPVDLGDAASQSAMLALNAGGRGCWPGDYCYRTDTAQWMVCREGNGEVIGNWAVYGGGGSGADLSDDTPLALATEGDAGTGDTASRSDHVHPLPVSGIRSDITTWEELGALVTASNAIPTGTVILWIYDGDSNGDNMLKPCRLIDGTDATDTASGIKRPDDYNGSTNARVWVQR